ncbi:MAG: glycosyltransferase family 2 protein [Tannerella sp.]|jgi:GT2 family glycosyltransferase|nr:glycosyltransferase family 2 protein [Tannerella sp.]
MEVAKPKKIAFCITCMNRLHHLQQTLEKNIRDNYLPEDVEFVLLDYNSKDGLDEWIRQNMQTHIDTGILVYYKTLEPEYYFRSHSRNMAFRLANAGILCNLDADNFLGEGFASFTINEFAAHESVFYTSDESSHDTFGRICVKQNDFLLIKGYNESLQGYGYEDVDLFDRLIKNGLERKFFHNPEFYRSVIHSKAERISNEYMIKNMEQMYITYINPYSSGILLLYRDYTFHHCILIDTPHLYRLPRFLIPDNYTEERNEVTLQEDYLKGRWQDKDNEIILHQNRNTEAFPKNESRIYYQNCPYYRILDKELETELIILLNVAMNRYSAQKQLRENQAVNTDGFGKGCVFKNFDWNTKIVLS